MTRHAHGTPFAARTAQPESFVVAAAVQPQRSFSYMFSDLQLEPGNLLPESDETVKALIALGETMVDANKEEDDRGADPRNSPIPAAFTYFGQFVDHDITREDASFDFAKAIDNPNNIKPDPSVVLHNTRTGTLDLDSVYEPAGPGQEHPPRDPKNPDRMQLSNVASIAGIAGAGKRPLGKVDDNDLPRKGPNSNNTPAGRAEDRAARIGDSRNDENTVVAQMHTAFLRAHNALVDTKGMTFGSARRDLILRYQSVVLDDFLPNICSPTIVADVLANGPRFLKCGNAIDFFMPLEFTAAAYRFGHSMIRSNYNFNVNFKVEPGGVAKASLELLFAFTALSGQLAPAPRGGVQPGEGFKTLPENWIIQWERFLPFRSDVESDPARRIDTLLTSMVFELRDELGTPIDVPGNLFAGKITKKLAIRNLLRGYILRLPTGQAVARAIGAPVLSGSSLTRGLPPDQAKALDDARLSDRTPLWFYILAEAASHLGSRGARLGPVGSRIVAETLWNAVKYADTSLLNPAESPVGWSRPHTLVQLIELSGGFSPLSTPASEF